MASRHFSKFRIATFLGAVALALAVIATTPPSAEANSNCSPPGCIRVPDGEGGFNC